MLVSAMAAVTKGLGFGVTVNVHAEDPYIFARRLSTLDHLTDGRIGWNIVTGYLDSAARAVGQAALGEHDMRYDRADECLDLLYALWEGSWDDDAVRRDRAARIYADPAKVRKIRHEGTYFKAEGYHLCEPSRQRTLVLYQAGTSGRGRQFASRHAECVFISSPDTTVARTASRAIRQGAVEAGRRVEDVRIFAGITVVVDRTEKAAREKFEDYARHASAEAGLAHFSAGTGIDFSQYDLDEPIAYGKGNFVQTSVDLARERGWTKRNILSGMPLGGRYPLIVGDPSQVADALETWIVEGEVDGFNLARTVVPESYEDFIDFVIPVLQERGRYKTAYGAGSLRNRLFGQGDLLPDRHPAGSFRRGNPAAE